MVHTSAPPPESRHSKLKKSFKLGIRSLLTSCCKEDVFKAFSTFNHNEKEGLHRMFIQVIGSLHRNIEEEFECTCQDVKVGSILDAIEQLVEEQNLDVLSTEKLNIGEIKENLSKVKEVEIHYLTSLLEKAEKQNNLTKARIETLRKVGVVGQDTSAAADAVGKLRSWNLKFHSS